MRELVNDIIAGELDTNQRRGLYRFGIFALLVLHIFLACGWLPGFEHMRFAQADEVGNVLKRVEDVERDLDGVRSEVRAIQQHLDVKDLELAQERICRAALTGNAEAVRYAAERKTKLIRSFRQATGQTPYVPTCEELGITGVTDE
jgi:hypothetical protein